MPAHHSLDGGVSAVVLTKVEVLTQAGGAKRRNNPFLIVVSNGEIAVKSVIEPEHNGVMPTLAAAGANFTCVSKDGLEKMFVNKLADNVKTNTLRMIFN